MSMIMCITIWSKGLNFNIKNSQIKYPHIFPCDVHVLGIIHPFNMEKKIMDCEKKIFTLKVLKMMPRGALKIQIAF
jgi:hypothetical protein